MKILLIDNDDVFIERFTKTLKAQHYIVDTVKDGEMGWTYSSTFEYDLIVMDILLPKLDGISLCKRLRAEGYATPILLLTAQDTSTTKVQGLDAGADDYVVKPFDQAELLARMRALVRRGSTNPFPLLTWGDLMLNPSTCEVSYGGQHLDLTTKEYELLELMLRDSQHVFSSDELLDHLWSSEKFPSEATVRSHIRRVRQKLVAIGAPQNFLATLHGRGYYLTPQADAAMAQATTPQILRSPQNTSAEASMGNSNKSLHSAPTNDRAPDTQDQRPLLNETLTTPKLDSLNQINLPRLLLVSADNAFNESLQAIAASRSVQVELVPPLALEVTLEVVGQLPDIILLRLPVNRLKRSGRDHAQMYALLQTCTQHYPLLPIVVMSDRVELHDRLEVAQHGGTLLDGSTPPEQVITTALNLLKGAELPTKVMIVDTDHYWLRTLPSLLKPWGFKVTTLADPQQFWTVLQAVTPDVLVLEVNLPQISGFELCQILRSDPSWQRLPVLFLSALTDANSQQQAFTVGADDYLYKPLLSNELANRILSRLQRVRAWVS